MMYGPMFKYYMMDKFMRFMNTDGWHTSAYEGAHSLESAEARWIPNDAMLEISHAIRKDGALTCEDCHTREGSVLDWKGLGYTSDEIENLIQNPLE